MSNGPHALPKECLMTVDDTTSGLQQALDALISAAGGIDKEPAAESAPTPARDVAVVQPVPMPEAPMVRLNDVVEVAWLELWYQPKIDLRQKCLAGAEALVRLRHPEHGLLSAENYGGADSDSLVRLFEQALMSALGDWSTLSDAGFNLRLAINVPVDLVLKLSIPKLVSENRPKAEHWPGLIVEVTEDAFVRDDRRAREIASALHSAGIAMAIDEFGAGYSSFATLRELTFAEIKINQSFVKGCANDATNAAICQTAVDLAHRFGSTAVAAGIDNIADVQALQIGGCDFGQGPLLSPAMTKERFVTLLQQRTSKSRLPQPPAVQHEELPATLLSA
jgi:EAL domain-containing protein (putative c-di-GMP-specific phosphodiesterase class I)